MEDALAAVLEHTGAALLAVVRQALGERHLADEVELGLECRGVRVVARGKAAHEAEFGVAGRMPDASLTQAVRGAEREIVELAARTIRERFV